MIRALEKIRDYDASKPEGYLDEWQESAAFGACQDIARDALEPGFLEAMRAAAEAALKTARDKVREARRSIGANARWFVIDHEYPQTNSYSGMWVRVLPKKPEGYYDNCVNVKVLELVGKQVFNKRGVGAEFTINAANLISEQQFNMRKP